MKVEWMRQSRVKTLICEWCNTPFQNGEGNYRYCSPTCRREHYNRTTKVAWRQANRDKVKDYKHQRRAIECGVGAESIDKAVVHASCDGLCGLCGHEVPLVAMTIDHMIPLSLGGSHTYDNVQSAHLVCNNKRQVKPLAGCSVC